MRGMLGTAIAVITTGSLLPNIAIRLIAKRIAGIDMKPSITRITTASTGRK